MGKIDPKVKNLTIFLAQNVLIPLTVGIIAFKYFGVTDYYRLFGQVTLAFIVWRTGLSIYRRMVIPPKKPLEYGKWAIVTGSTSGIGEEFARYLAEHGSSVLIISRSEQKLIEQQQLLSNKYKVPIRYLTYDFTVQGETRKKFYADLDETLKELDVDGGIGLLINNVGIANEIPKNIQEFSDDEIDNMLQCNIYSTVYMTRAVMKYMVPKKNGCVVSISSGSGNLPAPFLALYSSTKMFMTQFTRSLHVEWWGSGVDFLAVTPFYVVSNLYKRKGGTIIAPMPIKLVEGTLAQLGKRYIWEGHGYWFHGFLGNFAKFWWGAADRNRKMMVDNRKRYDERVASKQNKKEE